MTFEYKLVSRQFNSGDTIEQIIRNCNHSNMNDAAVRLIRKEFERVNADVLPLQPGEAYMFPVLTPFLKKHGKKQYRNALRTLS